MRNIIPILLGTPWWVYVLWGYILYIGVQATKTRVVSPGRLFVMPGIFTLWYIASMWHAPNVSLFHSCIWLGIAIIGALGGTLLAMQRTVQADHTHHLIKLSGTWMILAILLIIFAIKYYFGYACATASTDHLCSMYKMQSLLFSTCTSSLFWAHTLMIIYKYHRAPSTAL
jgi:hypothetical protein